MQAYLHARVWPLQSVKLICSCGMFPKFQPPKTLDNPRYLGQSPVSPMVPTSLPQCYMSWNKISCCSLFLLSTDCARPADRFQPALAMAFVLLKGQASFLRQKDIHACYGSNTVPFVPATSVQDGPVTLRDSTVTTAPVALRDLPNPIAEWPEAMDITNALCRFVIFALADAQPH